ncbi:MAG: hypothetical protein JWP97_3570, partial [Labilithrix sp.]|nr:hypothetical protein [Labilithrix sp.]
SSAVAWDDWTGGLATADPAAEPAPFGIGTVGARPPGDKGKPRESLVIERLDVRVTVDHDFAVTEVDETFVNPSGATVEGIFSFRTPEGAVLHRFGVDRDGEIVWGRVKESAAAQAQYESNVYQGSTEDPALLSWVAPGVYNARLYPIAPGARRRVVTRYAEWLSRQGEKADRRLYVYPMAAEGARGSLPRIEELRVSLDLGKAGAKTIRAGMNGVREGTNVVIQAFDFTPRADLAVELFDDGEADPVGYRARHALTAADLPMNADAKFAARVSAEEPDYLLVPLRRPAPPANAPKGIDLAIVVDTSAATEAGALSIARNLTSALLAHLGPDDRVALWSGDATLRPTSPGSGELAPVDAAVRRDYLAGLATVDRGGATDLGALLTEAAGHLDARRQGAVLYIGDGMPSVGEVSQKALHERLQRLPPGTRILAAGVGSRANVAILDAVARGAPAEVVGDAYGAARTALRFLEAVHKASWVSATVDLGNGASRVLPRDLPPVSAEESVLVVGRLTGKPPTTVTLKSGETTASRPLRIVDIEDGGDLRRRWGQGRVQELLAEGAGRAALVDIARRYALVSPYTSLYVPTSREIAQGSEGAEQDRQDARAAALERRRWWRPWSGSSRRSAPAAASEPMTETADKEGGGSRARGEEGSLGGSPRARSAAPPPPAASAMSAPSYDDAPAEERKRTKAAPAEPGMIGLIPQPAATATANRAAPPAPAQRAPRDEDNDGATAPKSWTSAIADAKGGPSGALSGIGEGGGGRGIGLGSIGTMGHGSGSGAPSGGHHASAPSIREGVIRIEESSAASTGIGVIGHAARPCGAAAGLPLAERRILWSERLAATGSTSADGALAVYRRALEDCEAPTWRERTTLLLQMVEQLRTVSARVALWKALVLTPAADVVYRAIVVRVQTVAELHELHRALGLASVDPDLLAAMVKKAKSPADKLSVLRAASLKWPDDLELGLRVLDAHEDAGDDGGGRAWARRLRRRPDATAHVWTSVGEYYLRLAAREAGDDAERDRTEARRTFGELVEFAPEDPAARRRLGDLLRAHGWYEEALRQYLTLQNLTPDDPGVALLLASAAQGLGRIEEAVGWAEKAAAAGSPDGKSALSRAARAEAAAILATAREDARRTGKKEESERLLARARRLLASSGKPNAEGDASVRILLTWAHPELHPSLWTSALGTPMPSPDNFAVHGVAEARLPAGPQTAEVRLEPDDAARAARLGLVLLVTVIQGEGTAGEKVVTQPLTFGTLDHPKSRQRLRWDGALHVEDAS